MPNIRMHRAPLLVKQHQRPPTTLVKLLEAGFRQEFPCYHGTPMPVSELRSVLGKSRIIWGANGYRDVNVLTAPLSFISV